MKNGIVDLVKGRVALNDQAVAAVRSVVGGEIGAVVRDELRPMRELMAALMVEISALRAEKFQAETMQVTLANPTERNVLGYDLIPKFQNDFQLSTLSADDRRREEMRRDIAVKVAEYALSIGKEPSKDTFGSFYGRFYRMLRAQTGYSPNKPTIFKYLNPYLGTKINTLIEDGYGYKFIALINAEIRKPAQRRKAAAAKRTTRKRTVRS